MSCCIITTLWRNSTPNEYQQMDCCHRHQEAHKHPEALKDKNFSWSCPRRLIYQKLHHRLGSDPLSSFSHYKVMSKTFRISLIDSTKASSLNCCCNQLKATKNHLCLKSHKKPYLALCKNQSKLGSNAP